MKAFAVAPFITVLSLSVSTMAISSAHGHWLFKNPFKKERAPDVSPSDKSIDPSFDNTDPITGYPLIINAPETTEDSVHKEIHEEDPLSSAYVHIDLITGYPVVIEAPEECPVEEAPTTQRKGLLGRFFAMLSEINQNTLRPEDYVEPIMGLPTCWYSPL